MNTPQNSPLITISKSYALDIVKLCMQQKNNILINQLLRSGTSIGANIHEGYYASSKADFINKYQIALKECHETDYWLNLFVEAGFISKNIYDDLYAKNSKIRKLLTSSIKTAKQIKKIDTE